MTSYGCLGCTVNSQTFLVPIQEVIFLIWELVMMFGGTRFNVLKQEIWASVLYSNGGTSFYSNIIRGSTLCASDLVNYISGKKHVLTGQQPEIPAYKLGDSPSLV